MYNTLDAAIEAAIRKHGLTPIRFGKYQSMITGETYTKKRIQDEFVSVTLRDLVPTYWVR